jgi:hypothetical protein
MTVCELRPSYVVRDNPTTNCGLRLVPRLDGTAIDIFDGESLALQVSIGWARELATGLMVMCEEMGK